MAINIKPLRDYSEHDVVSFFTLNAASGNRGSFVTIQGSGFVNGESLDYSAANPGSVSRPGEVTSPRWAIKAKVGLAASGSKAFGVILKDVREYNQFGYPLMYDPARKAEAQAVVSGESNPVLRKGLLLVSGIAGGMAPGSGVKVSDAGNGDWVTCTATDANKVGTILGMPDADGFVTVSLNAY